APSSAGAASIRLLGLSLNTGHLCDPPRLYPRQHVRESACGGVDRRRVHRTWGDHLLDAVPGDEAHTGNSGGIPALGTNGDNGACDRNSGKTFLAFDRWSPIVA